MELIQLLYSSVPPPRFFLKRETNEISCWIICSLYSCEIVILGQDFVSKTSSHVHILFFVDVGISVKFTFNKFAEFRSTCLKKKNDFFPFISTLVSTIKAMHFRSLRLMYCTNFVLW
jgi:hypothetical protein